MKPTFEELLEHAKMNAKSGESLCPSEELELIAGFEANYTALAAENAALKNAAIFLSDEAAAIYKRWNLTQQPDGDIIDMQTIHELMCACHETPATDAFLDEVRAQGVEMFAKEMHADISEGDALEFAPQLRQGAAQ